MWLSIILLGTMISCLIWVMQRKRWSWKIRLVIVWGMIILVSTAVYIFYEPGLVPLGENQWFNKSPIFQLFIFIFMIMGMAVRYVTNAIEERREKIQKLRKKAGKKGDFQKPKLEFDIWEFSYPFFFAVVSFALLLKQLDVPKMTVSNVILSFQTGFFWQTILKKEI